MRVSSHRLHPLLTPLPPAFSRRHRTSNNVAQSGLEPEPDRPTRTTATLGVLQEPQRTRSSPKVLDHVRVRTRTVHMCARRVRSIDTITSAEVSLRRWAAFPFYLYPSLHRPQRGQGMYLSDPGSPLIALCVSTSRNVRNKRWGAFLLLLSSLNVVVLHKTGMGITHNCLEKNIPQTFDTWRGAYHTSTLTGTLIAYFD